jgi:demethylmenaquinone methyltransferase/2-methoxy-6-polyprenyl-1,4-benzoquinol methylase
MSRPAQIQFLSRLARVYDVVVRGMGFTPLWRAMAAVAAPVPGERALDVCTGTGGVALELARRGARVIGLDLAGGMLRRARHKHNDDGPRAHFVQMDARHLAFADGSFSLVTCAMALHEMAEVERTQVLREVNRVASDRVIIADYRVPRDRVRALLFRVATAYEYIESDDFERFVCRDLGERLGHIGFLVGSPHDVGAYRIWPCRVTQRVAPVARAWVAGTADATARLQ